MSNVKTSTAEISPRNGIQKINKKTDIHISKLDTSRNIDRLVSYYDKNLIKKLLRAQGINEMFFASLHRHVKRIMTETRIRKKYFEIVKDNFRALSNAVHFKKKTISVIGYKPLGMDIVAIVTSSREKWLEDLGFINDPALSLKTKSNVYSYSLKGESIEEITCRLARAGVVIESEMGINITEEVYKRYMKYLEAMELQDRDEKELENGVVLRTVPVNGKNVPAEVIYYSSVRKTWEKATLSCEKAMSLGLGNCKCLKEHATFCTERIPATFVIENKYLLEKLLPPEAKKQLTEEENKNEKEMLISEMATYFETDEQDLLDDILSVLRFFPKEKVEEELQKAIQNTSPTTRVVIAIGEDELKRARKIEDAIVIAISDDLKEAQFETRVEPEEEREEEKNINYPGLGDRA